MPIRAGIQQLVTILHEIKDPQHGFRKCDNSIGATKILLFNSTW